MATTIPLSVLAVVTCIALAFVIRRLRRQKHQSDTLQSALLHLTEVEIDERLGGGNFGEVYRGTWQGSTDVALKKLKDSEHLQDFLREATALLSLNHPNIVRFLGLYSGPGRTAQVLWGRKERKRMCTCWQPALK